MFRKCLDINSQALFELLLFDLQCSLIEYLLCLHG